MKSRKLSDILFGNLPDNIKQDVKNNLKLCFYFERELKFHKEKDYINFDLVRHNILNDEVYILVLDDIKAAYEKNKKSFDFSKFGSFLDSLSKEECEELQNMSYEHFEKNQPEIQSGIFKKFSRYLLLQKETNYLHYALQVSSLYDSLPIYVYRYMFFKEFMWTLKTKKES